MELNVQIFKKIDEYYTFSKFRNVAHLKAAEKYKGLYLSTTTPIILLSTTTTVIASYNGNLINQWVAVAVAIFSGATTICQALAAFFEFNIKYETHFKTSNKYYNLARLIENGFFTNYFNTGLDITIKNEYIKDLFEKIQMEFLNIQNSEPCLPPSIANIDYSDFRFGTRLVKSSLLTDDNNDIPSNIPLNTDISSPSIVVASNTPKIVPSIGIPINSPNPLNVINTNSSIGISSLIDRYNIVNRE